jgi:hypothetical protein
MARAGGGRPALKPSSRAARRHRRYRCGGCRLAGSAGSPSPRAGPCWTFVRCRTGCIAGVGLARSRRRTAGAKPPHPCLAQRPVTPQHNATTAPRHRLGLDIRKPPRRGSEVAFYAKQGMAFRHKPFRYPVVIPEATPRLPDGQSNLASQDLVNAENA